MSTGLPLFLLIAILGTMAVGASDQWYNQGLSWEPPALSFIVSDDQPGIVTWAEVEGGPEESSGSRTLALGFRTPIPWAGSIDIRLKNPVVIGGSVAVFSLWAQGRNHRERLELLWRNSQGDQQASFLSRLNYQGWKQLTGTIGSSGGSGPIEFLGLRLHLDPFSQGTKASQYYFHGGTIQWRQ